jgi:hypothetical protein
MQDIPSDPTITLVSYLVAWNAPDHHRRQRLLLRWELTSGRADLAR